jgi:hypothetical protein
MSEYTDPPEYRQMFQYWEASCPSRFMILPYQPRFACKCGQHDWGSTTGFDWQSPSARIWTGESVCLSCQRMTRWLLDSDVPFEHQTSAMHRPIGSDATKPLNDKDYNPLGGDKNKLTGGVDKEALRGFLDKLKNEQLRASDEIGWDENGNIILPPQSDYDDPE